MVFGPKDLKHDVFDISDFETTHSKYILGEPKDIASRVLFVCIDTMTY